MGGKQKKFDDFQDIGDAIQDLAKHMDQRLEQTEQSLKTEINRVENKLDPTIDRLEDHEVRLKKLEQKHA